MQSAVVRGKRNVTKKFLSGDRVKLGKESTLSHLCNTTRLNSMRVVLVKYGERDGHTEETDGLVVTESGIWITSTKINQQRSTSSIRSIVLVFLFSIH